MTDETNHFERNAKSNSGEGFLGLLMLDTKFPRYPGDIGNPATFDFPVRKEIVSGASPDAIVLRSPEIFLTPFIEAARKLEREGARLISTSCGFLTVFQKELQDAVSIPVLSSSLFLYTHLQSLISHERKVGILTIAASSLSPRHLDAAGIPPDVPIGTTQSGTEFTAAILENRAELNRELARADNLAAAMELCANHDRIGALLLECTNMPPYAADIAEATGLPVFSINDGLRAMWNGRLTDIRLPQGAGSGSRNTA